MELTVLDAAGAPANAVLAIHMGSVRRQAKLEVNQPFVIPHPGAQSSAVEVSLFQQLASQVLPVDQSKSECGIPVRRPNGEVSEVKLSVRRGGDAAAVPEASKSVDKSKLTQAEVSAAGDYLGHHKLQQRIQGLIQDVLREQPENPYAHMVEQLKKARNEDSDALLGPLVAADSQAADALVKSAAPDAAAAPLVPKPPDKPRPDAKAAPRSARSFVKLDPTSAQRQSNLVSPETCRLRIEAKRDARAVIRGCLSLPECLEAARESLREDARSEEAKGVVASVLSVARGQAITRTMKAQTPQQQARASVMQALKSSAVVLSYEYTRCLTKVVTHLALRGAVTVLRKDDTKRIDCFETGRRGSLPTPIVSLDSNVGSWGAWLGAST